MWGLLLQSLFFFPRGSQETTGCLQTSGGWRHVGDPWESAGKFDALGMD